MNDTSLAALKSGRRVKQLFQTIGRDKIDAALSTSSGPDAFADKVSNEVSPHRDKTVLTNLLFQAVEWKDSARAEVLAYFGADLNASRHVSPGARVGEGGARAVAYMVGGVCRGLRLTSTSARGGGVLACWSGCIA